LYSAYILENIISGASYMKLIIDILTTQQWICNIYVQLNTRI